MRDRSRRCRTRPFSLLEIMIVVIIIGMITGIVGPNIYKKIGVARRNKARAQVLILKGAVQDYYVDMSEFPQKLADLVTDTGNDKWEGPYLDPAKIPLDPWGEEYKYVFPGTHGEFDLYSMGADKTEGGEGKNADVVSWDVED